MRLLELEPQFLRHRLAKAPKHHGRPRPDGTMQWGGFQIDTFRYGKAFAGADGIQFLCPKCYAANGGAVGTHGLQVFFVGSKVPDRIGKNAQGQTVRWGASGTGYADLTLTPSILLLGGCAWHGWITRGDVISC